MTRSFYRGWLLAALGFMAAAMFFSVTGSNLNGFLSYYNAIFHRSNFAILYLSIFIFGIFKLSNFLSAKEAVIRYGNFLKLIKEVQIAGMKYCLIITSSECIALYVLTIPFCGTKHLINLEYFMFLIAFFLLQIVGWLVIFNLFWCVKLALKGNVLSWIITMLLIGIPAVCFGEIETHSQIEYLICVYKSMYIIEGNSIFNLSFHLIYMTTITLLLICIMFFLLWKNDYLERKYNEKDS